MDVNSILLMAELAYDSVLSDTKGRVPKTTTILKSAPLIAFLAQYCVLVSSGIVQAVFYSNNETF